jgi:hypothetical protein
MSQAMVNNLLMDEIEPFLEDESIEVSSAPDAAPPLLPSIKLFRLRNSFPNKI